MQRGVYFSLFLFLLVMFLVRAPLSFAQESDTIMMSPNEASQGATMPTPPLSGATDYQLPYPGLLPDNPLYFLKIFRDRLINFIIADPLKKAEFDLLQADKHATMAVALTAKGKQQLAETTLSKGENYLEAGIGQLDLAKKQGMDAASLAKRYVPALKKHKELIAGLVAGASGDTKNKFENTGERLKDFEKQVSELIPK